MSCTIKPTSISIETIKSKSYAEYEIYHKINSLTDKQAKDWIVYYSYKYRKMSLFACLRDQKDFEIDYLFLIPNNGIYLLEVKGGKIIKKDGELYSIDSSNKEHKIDPLSQARNNFYTFKLILKQGYKFDLDNYNCNYLLAFPDIDNIEDLGLGLSSDEIITKSTDLYSFFINLNNKNKDNNKKPFTLDDQKALCDILNGKDFSFEISEKELVYEINQSIENKTSEMLDIYKNILYENPRCMITGIAGSGKTNLAVDVYQHELKCKHKPLMLVFNIYLCNKLNHENQDSCHLFYAFIDSIYSKYNEPLPDTMSFMDKKKIWFEFLETQEFKLDYDTLIIDEAQDIEYHKDIIKFLNNILKDGLDNGRWYIFYDQRQKVFIKDTNKAFYEVHDFNEYRPTRLTLNKNIRNNEEIGSLINKYSNYLSVDKRIKFDELLTSSENVGYYKDNNIDNVFNKIVELIERLNKTSDYKYRQITILNNKWDSIILKKLQDKYGPNLREYTPDSKVITYSTLRKFKGLDNDVIIYLHDGIALSLEQDYVVLTRAKIRFYMFDCVEETYSPFKYDIKNNCLKDIEYKMERNKSILDNLVNYDFFNKISDNNRYKGQEINNNNQIEDLTITNKEISTIVHGTNDYNVSVYRDGVNTCFTCNCPFIDAHPTIPCKHMVSLMIKIKNRNKI